MAVVDRLKYDAPSDDVLVWKHPAEDLRLGTQLIVNESQEALFVKGGQALDMFGPGTHTLATSNVPLLNKLVNLPFGGKTPFTAEVWYVSKTAKRNLKWGTKAPIPLLDPVYSYPVSVRAFGQWGIRIANSRSFLTQLVGTLRTANADTIDDYFSGEIVQRLSDALARFFTDQKLSIFEANARLNELSASITRSIADEFARFGIEITNFNVERISIPAEEKQRLQEVLGKRLEIDQIGQARVGAAYTTMRTFDTLEAAAKNEGGPAGALLSSGLGLGAGLSVGRQIGDSVGVGSAQPSTGDPVDRLKRLKAALEAGLISQQDFDTKKQQILDQM
jgi:membrane protease subunit (stomatin/prohibitin family)